MATRIEKRIATLNRQIAEQRQWIETCGGSRMGYIRRYGSANDPDHYGDGGEAIFKADDDALRRLQGELARLLGTG